MLWSLSIFFSCSILIFLWSFECLVNGYPALSIIIYKPTIVNFFFIHGGKESQESLQTSLQEAASVAFVFLHFHFLILSDLFSCVWRQNAKVCGRDCNLYEKVCARDCQLYEMVFGRSLHVKYFLIF